MAKSLEENQKGVQSVEFAAKLLGVLSEVHGPLKLKQVAEATGMSMSRAHSYLVSLVRAGLVDRVPGTGYYELGPFIVQLGIRALNNIDSVQVSTRALQELRERIDLTLLLVVWGEHGPTLIHWDRSPTRPLMLNINVGSTLPLITTAAGRLFLAFMPRKVTAPHVKKELAMLSSEKTPFPVRTRSDVQSLIDDIRGEGLAWAQSILFPAQIAVAAPIFDHQHQIVAALSMTSFDDESMFAEDSEEVQQLKAVTSSASEKLGFYPEGTDDAEVN